MQFYFQIEIWDLNAAKRLECLQPTCNGNSMENFIKSRGVIFFNHSGVLFLKFYIIFCFLQTLAVCYYGTFVLILGIACSFMYLCTLL